MLEFTSDKNNEIFFTSTAKIRAKKEPLLLGVRKSDVIVGSYMFETPLVLKKEKNRQAE